MSIDEYLRQNIDPKILEEAYEFEKSLEYKKIQEYTKSKKFQDDKKQVILRGEKVHKTILSDIQKLQDNFNIASTY
ncbi:hypothetical protein CSA08_04380 [Candidatus Gracilibacteria bacterium]|nr:MAG: hypothetical protein CSA08_04380 [Candidatus Gracilibacteria bacterium]